MEDTRIILVEGMPGTGKSTVSQFVHQQLLARSYDSNWYHEEAVTHPVRLFYQPKQHLSWFDYCENVISCWEKFTIQLQERNQTAVLDAGILQNHVRSMLIFDCNRNLILDLVCRIEALIAALNPVLIYLRPENIEKNFSDVCDVRGQKLQELWIAAHDQYPYTLKRHTSGLPGFLAFWEEFTEISDQIFDGLTIRKLRQDITNEDRDTRYAEILDFLKIPSPLKSFLPPDLDCFTGKYEPLENENASACILHAKDDCLIASVEQPTFNVNQGPIGCFHEVRLIPRGKNQFHVEAWPHNVQFIEDTSGKIIKLTINTSDEGWLPCSQIYLKQ